ncbi:hypothetical protein GCM10010467_11040 [Actinocorallia glomerata]|uniref:Uncharacterized protein n=2 Tax=Actinomycetes TaxID=1760 RepID=A0ABP6LZE1_9MICC
MEHAGEGCDDRRGAAQPDGNHERHPFPGYCELCDIYIERALNYKEEFDD